MNTAIIFFGAPGSGKGTQAELLRAKCGLEIIATSPLLHQVAREQGALAREIRETIERGDLVSDDNVMKLIVRELKKPLYQEGFILDGFPRTLKQAILLEERELKMIVFSLKVPEELIICRLSSRRVHPSSGRIYNLFYNPPQIDGLDDITGEPLVQREDDKQSVILRRLAVYQEITAGIFHHWNLLARENDNIRCYELDGSLSAQEIHDQILEIVVKNNIKWSCPR